MACDRNKQRILRLVAWLGLSRAASQSAYLAGALAGRLPPRFRQAARKTTRRVLDAPRIRQAARWSAVAGRLACSAHTRKAARRLLGTPRVRQAIIRSPEAQKAALVSGAVIGLTAFAAIGRALEKRADSARQETADSSAALPAAKARPAIKPVAPKKGQRCASCGADASKPGLWYTLDGKQYCIDCAPEAAEKVNVALSAGKKAQDVKPALTAGSAGQSSSAMTAYRGIDVRLVQKPLDIFVMDGEQRRLVHLDKNAFVVFDRNRDTGMAVVREPAGVWAVVHTDTGMSLSSGMESIYEAEGLASLLASINWNRPFDEMPDQELQIAGAIIGEYERKLAALKGK